MEDRSLRNINDNPLYRIKLILNTLVHISIGIVIYIVYYNAITNIAIQLSSEKFKLHIIFSVTGYQFLMFEGILSLSEINSWTLLMSRNLRRWVHLILQVLGAVFVIVGFALAVSAKSINILNSTHFSSGHGICGLIGFIFTLISLLNGTTTFLLPKLRDRVRPTVVKFVHTLCGCLSIVFGLVTLSIGLNKPLLGNTTSTAVATAFAVLSLAYSLMRPVLSIKGYLDNMRSTEL